MYGALLALALLPAALAKVALQVRPDGSYRVTHDGIALDSAQAAFAVRYDGALHSTADGSLKLDAAPAPISGSDALGAYTGFALAFNANKFAASFKLYAALDALLFSQTFPAGLSAMAAAGDSSPANDLSTAFPVFGPAADKLNNTNLAFLTWPDCFSTGHTGVWDASAPAASGLRGTSGTPLVLFSPNGSALIMSPVSGMMTAQIVFAGAVGTALGVGHNGAVTEVPAGWTQESLLVGGGSVNATVMAWGDILLARSGKHRTVAGTDVVISTLGWWSGAYK